MADDSQRMTQIKFKFHARRDEYMKIRDELISENPGVQVSFEISLSPNAALRPKGTNVDE
jgi:hypothetical protein